MTLGGVQGTVAPPPPPHYSHLYINQYCVPYPRFTLLRHLRGDGSGDAGDFDDVGCMCYTPGFTWPVAADLLTKVR
jgi:hypothetical protein